MRSRILLLAIAAAVLAAACPAEAKRPDLPPLRADPDRDDGGRILDSNGREVLLRGANVNALAEYWQGIPFPTVFPLRSNDPKRMAGIGWNAVRLLLSWSRVEPQPGRYDSAYLKAVVTAISRLARRGIYTIVDLHQDAWGPTLAAREGELCLPGTLPALGWDGAPEWATLDGGLPRCYANFREASPAVGRAWQAFLADEAGPGGVGVQARYVAMLGHVARRFARTNGVAGFDLMNEPNAFAPTSQSQLSEMYGRALESIRAGERAGRGRRHLVLFEPSALWSAIGSGPPPDFPRDRDVVYAPHIYTGGFDNGPITREAFQVARDEARGFGGVPVVTGEWGSDPKRAKDPGDPYFLDHQRFQDEFRFGATLWTWRESCGDPHKVADFRAGRVPEVWGEFEVDCNSNRVTGLRPALIRQLTRGYVRAAPGRLLTTVYDEAAGTLIATGRSGGGDGPLEAFYPRAKHGGMRVRTKGLRRVRSRSTPGDGRLIIADPRRGGWSLSVSPR